MAQGIHLKFICLQISYQVMVILCTQVPEGLDVFEETLGRGFFHFCIILVKFIPKAENHWIIFISILPVDVVDVIGLPGVNVTFDLKVVFGC